MKTEWMKKKRIIAGFSILALIGGILFLDPSITGNLILEKKVQFDFLSLIGILLILGSMVLASYSIKNK
jgi:drug/metabolite transporter (DMT)-like permease